MMTEQEAYQARPIEKVIPDYRCPECDGVGSVDAPYDEVIDCPKCQGTGQLNMWRDVALALEGRL